jgi:hypothetical protein
VKFEYAVPTNPIQVRYPETGFEGSAYTVANLQNELKIYDEMLAVGYEYNQPVTTAARLFQYSLLARYVHAMHKDLIYVGGLTLDGLRYDYQRLDRRVNIAAVDGDGAAIETGWENIDAYLTDVEYDYDQQLTTLLFSSDQMEQIAMDIDEVKKRLKIKALEQRYWYTAQFQNIIRPRTISEPIQGISALNPVSQTVLSVQSGVEYIDPDTGLPQ